MFRKFGQVAMLFTILLGFGCDPEPSPISSEAPAPDEVFEEDEEILTGRELDLLQKVWPATDGCHWKKTPQEDGNVLYEKECCTVDDASGGVSCKVVSSMICPPDANGPSDCW